MQIHELSLAQQTVPTARDVETAPRLQLTTVEGGIQDVVRGTTLNIGPTGYENSQRNNHGKTDWFTFFGTRGASAEATCSLEKVENDVFLEEEGEEDEHVKKRFFMIKYSPEKRTYLLKDLGDGSGTFVRLD